MARLGPDAARYVLAGSGTAVPRPFHLRWLLPALCRDDIEAWRFVWPAQSLPLPPPLSSRPRGFRSLSPSTSCGGAPLTASRRLK